MSTRLKGECVRKCNRGGRCAGEGEDTGGFGHEQRVGGFGDSGGDREQLLSVLPQGFCLQKLYLPP